MIQFIQEAETGAALNPCKLAHISTVLHRVGSFDRLADKVRELFDKVRVRRTVRSN